MRFEVIRSTTNKARWTLRQMTDSGPNIVHFTQFTSKKAAQEWADRLNAAFGGGRKC